MLVLIDMEWTEPRNGIIYPTQIAAIRVDENWSVVSRYSSLIRPYDASSYDGQHEAYSGATQGAFLTAKGAHRVFEEIEAWFWVDDKVSCWDNITLGKFQKITRVILKQKTKAQIYPFTKRVKALIKEGRATQGNVDGLIQEKHVPALELTHCAKKDVEAVRQYLSYTLLKPSNVIVSEKKKDLSDTIIRKTQKGKEEATDCPLNGFPYWLDVRKNIIHVAGCQRLLKAKEVKGYGTLTSVLKLHSKACGCIVQEYRQAAEKRNIDILNRCQYNYVYADNSAVFHRYDCRAIRAMYTGNLKGAVYYDACIEHGKKPCRICNPTPYLTENYSPIVERLAKKPDPVIPTVTKPKKRKYSYTGTNYGLNMAEQKAYKRFCEAKKERKSLDQSIELSPDERKDFLTLTHPGYAFWAARGYSTFHLRNCPKLNGLKDLKGFALYQDAVRAGLTPCKQCKPKEKHEIKVSIPLSNYTRFGETLDMLDAMCDEFGYTHQYDDRCYIIVTPVGKWRIDVYARPVKVEHVNFVTSGQNAGYHKQPRIFLSLTDTFNYIQRHDQSLEEKLHTEE